MKIMNQRDLDDSIQSYLRTIGVSLYELERDALKVGGDDYLVGIAHRLIGYIKIYKSGEYDVTTDLGLSVQYYNVEAIVTEFNRHVIERAKCKKDSGQFFYLLELVSEKEWIEINKKDKRMLFSTFLEETEKAMDIARTVLIKYAQKEVVGAGVKKIMIGNFMKNVCLNSLKVCSEDCNDCDDIGDCSRIKSKSGQILKYKPECLILIPCKDKITHTDKSGTVRNGIEAFKYYCNDIKDEINNEIKKALCDSNIFVEISYAYDNLSIYSIQNGYKLIVKSGNQIEKYKCPLIETGNKVS